MQEGDFRLLLKLINLTLFTVSGLLVIRCANPVTPSGGPKDTTPPVILKSEPPVNSVNFSERRIKITFNEFIQLKDINSQVIISPPVTSLPKFKLRGKSLIIELTEPVKENSTYNIFLGNSIVDLTESNPLENFQYVFSTGKVIDSLSIAGSVFNARDLTPAKGINVMLYLDNNDTIPFDSLPYFVRPYYLTKTDGSGKFILSNLMHNSFKLFALNDQNGNLIFDQPGEEIAFLDSLITPVYQKTSEPDSVEADSTTITAIENLFSLHKGIALPLFTEMDSTQRLIRAGLINPNLLSFIFKKPASNLSIKALNLPDSFGWGIEEANPTNDTINFWIKNILQDSVVFEISENGIIFDTVTVSVTKKGKDRTKGKIETDTTLLTIKPILKTNHSELYEPFLLAFEYPVTSYNLSGLQLFEYDSIPVVADFSFTNRVQRRLSVDYPWKGGVPYRLMVYDSAFVDILNRTHDTLVFNFTSKTAEDYGNFYLNLTLKEPGKQIILHLLSGEKIETEQIITGSQRISLLHLKSGEYRLKAITDENTNGRWDTGDYICKIQPEKVEFFGSVITVRANWDIEEDWEL